MYRAVNKFTNSILFNGKSMSSEKLLKFLIKRLIKISFKFYYKLLKLLSAYLSSVFIFKKNVKLNKLFNISNDKIHFGLKYIVNNLKLNNKHTLLLDLSELFMKNKQLFVKFFEYSRLLFFYRW